MAVLKDDVIQKMQEIVDDCMGDSNAACITACPMNTDAKGYVKLIGEGKGKEAIKLIREKLFIPGVLGRICPHGCETKCRRSEEDAGIAIAALKRYASDNFDNSNDWDLTKKSSTGKKIAVIGSGPAGAQAALDLARDGHSVTIYEKSPVVGGMMRLGIPEYRLPREIIDGEYSLLSKLGIEIKLNAEVGKDISFEDLKEKNDAVLVAVGRQIGRVEKRAKNFDAVGTFNAADFLKEASLTKKVKGIGKKVVVIGGGDVAMDCSRVSLRIGEVEEVYNISLEKDFDEMPASEHEIHGAKEEKVNFKCGFGIFGINLDKDGKIKSADIIKCTSIFDKDKNFNPQFDEKNIETIECDTVIFAIGQAVDNSFDKNSSLNLKKNGTFDADMLTLQSVSSPKVFVAGDCASALVVVGAMAEGRRAAKSITRFLGEKDLKEGRKLEEEGGSSETKLYLPKEYLPEGWDAAEKKKRKIPKTIDVEKRTKNFAEVEKVFTKEEAEKEASRCLQCECKLCMKECIMLNDYTSCPKELFSQYLEKGLDDMDSKIAYSCNMCDQCTLKCPKEFKIKVPFSKMRSAYVLDNCGKSPMKGHKAIEIHQALGFSKVFNTTNSAPNKHKTKYAFFPGCSLPSYNPNAVGKILEHLEDKLGEEVGSVLKCCGKPPKALGQDDLFKKRFETVQTELDKLGAEYVIVACQSCYGIFRDYAKQKVISLWELLPEIGLPEKSVGIGKNSDAKFNIHDSCSIRGQHKIHDGIRWIMKNLGYQIEELENSRDKTRCCGFGGMIVPAVPDVAKRVMDRRAHETTTGHMVTYCAACRESMEKGGTDAVHILDLVFGDTYNESKSASRNQGPVKQWMNRYKSKQELQKVSKCYVPKKVGGGN
ncbi:MAG: FAD-dependent oxidoreductase [Fusobacteriaceae bacterium]